MSEHADHILAMLRLLARFPAAVAIWWTAEQTYLGPNAGEVYTRSFQAKFNAQKIPTAMFVPESELDQQVQIVATGRLEEVPLELLQAHVTTWNDLAPRMPLTLIDDRRPEGRFWRVTCSYVLPGTPTPETMLYAGQ